MTNAIKSKLLNFSSEASSNFVPIFLTSLRNMFLRISHSGPSAWTYALSYMPCAFSPCSNCSSSQDVSMLRASHALSFFVSLNPLQTFPKVLCSRNWHHCLPDSLVLALHLYYHSPQTRTPSAYPLGLHESWNWTYNWLNLALSSTTNCISATSGVSCMTEFLTWHCRDVWIVKKNVWGDEGRENWKSLKRKENT